MGAKPAPIAFYSDTLWKTTGGHYFRLWVWVSNRTDNLELVNEETLASARFTAEQLAKKVNDGVLIRVWE